MRFYAAHQRIGKNVANAGTGSVSDFVVETAGAHTFAFHGICAVGNISDQAKTGQFCANGFFIIAVFWLFNQR